VAGDRVMVGPRSVRVLRGLHRGDGQAAQPG
jgi:hypothetical protein